MADFEGIQFYLMVPSGNTASFMCQGVSHVSFNNNGSTGATITAYCFDASKPSKVLGNFASSPQNCEVDGYDYIVLSSNGSASSGYITYID